MTVGHAELSEYAEVSSEAATAFLEAFSMPFGQPESADAFPRATHPLQRTPLIRYGQDSYFLAAPHLLAWSVKTNVEARLKSEPGAPWKNYEENRAKLVARKALDYLSAVMPANEHFEELYYEFQGQRFELDGLLLFDRYVLLLEATQHALPLGQCLQARRAERPCRPDPECGPLCVPHQRNSGYC